MNGSKYENPRRLPVTSPDENVMLANKVTEEAEEVDFTNAESRAAYKNELDEQVATIVKRSTCYFKRASAEHTLRSYDKIGLQHTALIQAFYKTFQTQFAKIETLLSDGETVEVYIGQLKRSYENIQVQIGIVNKELQDALDDRPEDKADEVLAPEAVSNNVSLKEKIQQPETLTYLEINTLMDSLTSTLLKLRHSEQVKVFKNEISQAIFLRGKLINLVRRINHFQINEKDAHIKNIMLLKAYREMNVTQREVLEYIQSVEQKLNSLSIPESVDAEPTVLVEQKSERLILDNSIGVEVGPSLTDLFNRAQEQTAQAVGHDDEGTVTSLWENYNRLNQTEGHTEGIRKLLQSIIDMTKNVGLTQQAFDTQLDKALLTSEQRHTATMLYEKYRRDKQQHVPLEQLAQDIANIENFLSMEGVGIEDILNRVDTLEVDIAAKTWSKEPDEDVLGNLMALILNVRKLATADNANVGTVKTTFNVLQEYYYDQLKQQSPEKIGKEQALQQFERSKTEYLTALERLSSIRSAIASGEMPQRAIDEFLDPAIDDVERAQRAYQNDLGKAEVFGKIEITDVTTAETDRPSKSFFERVFKPSAKKVASVQTGKEAVPGVVLNYPFPEPSRQPGDDVYSKKIILVETEPSRPPETTFNLSLGEQMQTYVRVANEYEGALKGLINVNDQSGSYEQQTEAQLKAANKLEPLEKSYDDFYRSIQVLPENQRVIGSRHAELMILRSKLDTQTNRKLGTWLRRTALGGMAAAAVLIPDEAGNKSHVGLLDERVVASAPDLESDPRLSIPPSSLPAEGVSTIPSVPRIDIPYSSVPAASAPLGSSGQVGAFPQLSNNPESTETPPHDPTTSISPLSSDTRRGDNLPAGHNPEMVNRPAPETVLKIKELTEHQFVHFTEAVNSNYPHVPQRVANRLRQEIIADLIAHPGLRVDYLSLYQDRMLGVELALASGLEVVPEPGSNLTTEFKNYFAAELAALSDDERNSLTEDFMRSLQHEPDVLTALGIYSGDVDLIYYDHLLKLSELRPRVERAVSGVVSAVPGDVDATRIPEATEDGIVVKAMTETNILKVIDAPVPDTLTEPLSKITSESINRPFLSKDLLQVFNQEYKPNQQAYADHFETWLDSIQGVHPSRFSRIFNTNEHVNVYDVIKNMSIADVRNLIRSPQTELPKYKIKPEDFDHWRRFMTTMFMVPGIRTEVADTEKFSVLAEFGFMHDSIQKKRDL